MCLPIVAMRWTRKRTCRRTPQQAAVARTLLGEADGVDADEDEDDMSMGPEVFLNPDAAEATAG